MPRTFTLVIDLEAPEFYDETGTYDPGYALAAVLEILSDKVEGTVIGDNGKVEARDGTVVGEWRMHPEPGPCTLCGGMILEALDPCPGGDRPCGGCIGCLGPCPRCSTTGLEPRP